MPDAKLEQEALDHLMEAFECCQSAGCTDDQIGLVVKKAYEVVHPPTPMRSFDENGVELEEDASAPMEPAVSFEMNMTAAENIIAALDPATGDPEILASLREVLVSAVGSIGAHMAEHHANGEN